MNIFNWVDYSWEVQKAHMSRQSVVAIETAGVFEAFPYPLNIEVAKKVSDAIREKGAHPAFIGLVGGRIKVGLEQKDIERLANPEKPLMKASRRDIPMLLAKKEDALTSVAATMMIADLAGIRVVTGGGMGGVHRGAETSFDISADLTELTRSQVIVVCSGIKSILDLKLSMEYLETHSVSIAGYRTKELPAYMAIHSGIELDFRLDSPAQAAEAFRAKRDLEERGCLVVANPINGIYAVDSDAMNVAIEKALVKAEEAGIRGKELTKFILGIVREELGEDSQESSIQMLIGNAVLAAKIAEEL